MNILSSYVEREESDTDWAMTISRHFLRWLETLILFTSHHNFSRRILTSSFHRFRNWLLLRVYDLPLVTQQGFIPQVRYSLHIPIIAFFLVLYTTGLPVAENTSLIYDYKGKSCAVPRSAIFFFICSSLIYQISILN